MKLKDFEKRCAVMRTGEAPARARKFRDNLTPAARVARCELNSRNGRGKKRELVSPHLRKFPFILDVMTGLGGVWFESRLYRQIVNIGPDFGARHIAHVAKVKPPAIRIIARLTRHRAPTLCTVWPKLSLADSTFNLFFNEVFNPVSTSVPGSTELISEEEARAAHAAIAPILPLLPLMTTSAVLKDPSRPYTPLFRIDRSRAILPKDTEEDFEE